MLTVIEDSVELLLHSRLPSEGIVVESVDVPLQLFTTVTTGVAGTAFGADMRLPGTLVQPLTVCVTV